MLHLGEVRQGGIFLVACGRSEGEEHAVNGDAAPSFKGTRMDQVPNFFLGIIRSAGTESSSYHIFFRRPLWIRQQSASVLGVDVGFFQVATQTI